jgi:peptide/nickel transport system permease protein
VDGVDRVTELDGARARRRVPWLVVLGALLLAVIGATAAAAPRLAPYDPAEQRPRERVQGPSRAHPFGTDRLGRDVYSRALYGGRTSLTASAAAVALTLTLGVALGLLAGSAGGVVDGGIMRVVDVLLASPPSSWP